MVASPFVPATRIWIVCGLVVPTAPVNVSPANALTRLAWTDGVKEKLAADSNCVSVKFTELPPFTVAVTMVCKIACKKLELGKVLAGREKKTRDKPSLSVRVVAWVVPVAKKIPVDPFDTQVIVAPLTGAPFASVTLTTNGCRVRLEILSICPFPETTEILFCAEAVDANASPATAAANKNDLSLFKWTSCS